MEELGLSARAPARLSQWKSVLERRSDEAEVEAARLEQVDEATIEADHQALAVVAAVLGVGAGAGVEGARAPATAITDADIITTTTRRASARLDLVAVTVIVTDLPATNVHVPRAPTDRSGSPATN